MTEHTRPTVLVVDDEPLVVELVEQILKDDGYEVITATSGAQAVDVCAASDRHVDLLLTDVQMPEMTGRMLAVTLGKSQLGMKVLYLTGHCEDLFTSLDLRPHEAFIKKPTTATALRSAVDLHLYLGRT